MIRISRYTINSGFTLVELLIVIVIIGILAGIGLVSWSGAQNNARRNSFATTANQVKLKIGEYYTDNNAYPQNKNAVTALLSGSLSTEFTKTAYVYTASPSGCTTACTSYSITVAGSNWNQSSDSITVSP